MAPVALTAAGAWLQGSQRSRSALAAYSALDGDTLHRVHIVLQTHSADPALALEELQRIADGSGYCCQLAVRSHGFAGRALFCFEVEAFDAFRTAVAELDRTLDGTARLQPRYEGGHVELAMGSTGAVFVSGEVVLASEFSQMLRFEFRTDQTCLRPLVRDLEECASMAAV